MKIVNIVIVLFAHLALISCTAATVAIPTENSTNQTPALMLAPTATAQSQVIEPPTQLAPSTYEFFPSPDGKRILRSIEALDANKIEIVKDGIVEWSISFNRANPDLLHETYSPYFWSKDGKYLYLKVWISMDGGFGAFYTGSGLSRFDLHTGDVTEIIPEGGMFAFAVSPDESQIAYANESENPVVLRSYNLDTHTQQALLTLNKKYTQAGSIGWSPQMDKLIFMTMEVEDAQSSDYSFGIFQFDLGSKKLLPLISNYDHWLKFISWNDQSQVLYTDWEDTVWQLDLKSNVLSAKGTATPKP